MMKTVTNIVPKTFVEAWDGYSGNRARILRLVSERWRGMGWTSYSYCQLPYELKIEIGKLGAC
jgi:hypothetical protein